MNFFPSISNFFEKKSESGKAGVFHENILFPIDYKFTKFSDKLVVFYPGAFDKKKLMPSFQRSSYFKFLPYNCLSLFDPTLFLSDDENFSIGWFQGNTENFYANTCSDLIRNLTNLMGISSENVLLFATSAGGIPAIKTADKIQGCNVFLGNIQTNVFGYFEKHVQKMMGICYEGESLQSIKNKYYERLSIENSLINSKVFYAQNISDKFHYDRFFSPYIKNCKIIRGGELQAVVYDDAKSGHSPLHRDYEIEIIESIFNGKGFFSVYEGFLKNTYSF